ncbi:MAG: hypothetical protein ACLQBD_18405 [Syntrophobacteraceae bacterium]
MSTEHDNDITINPARDLCEAALETAVSEYVAGMNQSEIDALHLLDIADGLDKAERFGASSDDPEGIRVIQLSDTLATMVAGGLRQIAKRLKEKSS